jgi:hypothetical protein
VLALTLLFACSMGAQQETLRTVSGSVINSVTGVGISGALVILQPGPRRPSESTYENDVQPRGIRSQIAEKPPQRMVTDPSGSFSFSIASDVMFAQLTVSRRGFRSEQRMDTAQIHLNPDQMANTTVKLVPLAAIEGRVLNEDGEPLPGVTVANIQVNLRNGRRVFREDANKTTDDRGEYRLWNLSPGMNYIKVFGRRGTWTGVGGLAQMALSDEAYGPVYYPNASTRDEGQVLRVGPGETVRADFVVQGRKAYKIRGRLQGLTAYVRPSVRLLRGDDPIGVRASVNIATGIFEISDVTPGSYLVQAYATNSTNPVLGEAPITIAERDLTDVMIAMNSGVNIRGSIDFPAGPAAPSGRNGRRQSTTIQALNIAPERLPFPAAAITASADESGQFTLNNLMPGRYALTVTGSGTVASIQSGAVDVLSDGLTVGYGDMPELKIVLSRNAGQVECSLEGGAGGGVSLTVAAVRTRGASVQTTLQRMAGDRVIFGNLAPGDYTIYAWPFSRQVEYESAAALASLAAYGVPVTIGDGAHERITLKVAPEQEP